MSSWNPIRWGGLAAMLAGTAFVFDSLFVFTVFDGGWIVAVCTVAPLLALAGLWGLHALQKDHYGLLGRSGLWAVVVASLARVGGTVVPLQGSDTLYWLAYPVGTYGLPAGLVIYGVATLRARVLPRWCGMGLIYVPPLAAFFEGLYGALWLALGYVRWSRRGSWAAEQPARLP